MKVQSFKQLDVWKKGLDIVDRIYEATAPFPNSELFGLTSQLRRCAVSIPSNIAEGFGRQHTKEYIHFCHIAMGSCAELEAQLIIARRRGFLDDKNFSILEELLDHEGRMLTNLIKSLKALSSPAGQSDTPRGIYDTKLPHNDEPPTIRETQFATHDPRPTTHDRAFTLIEILVSITLTAIIIVAATGIWISCTRGWTYARQHERTTGHDDMVTQRVRELFERAMLEKSSRDLFEWKCDNQFEGPFPADKISFTTRWPVELEQGRTMLVPVRGSLGMESVSAGRNTGKRLTWNFGPFSGESRDGSEPESVIFSSEIQSLNLRYWWKEAGRWQDDWREQKDWPEAVEVEMTFADSANPPRMEKFVIALPAPTEPPVEDPAEASPAPAVPETEKST